VVSWRTPNTYLTAVRAGDRHLNFYETRDNLFGVAISGET
jgi:hypothetical protein